MQLFGRTVRLAVDNLVLDGLDIAFDVERNDGDKPNKASISVFNLSAASRSFVEAKGKTASLSAGLGGQVGLIFNGDITRTVNERQGPDIVTTLECGDGEKAYRMARVDISLEPGVTDAQVLRLALAELSAQGLGLGHVEGFSPQPYKGGYCFSGPARKLLDEICNKRGLVWSIQGGVVEVWKKGEERENEQGFLLSAESGLVGFPSKKNGLLTAKALLNPHISPNRRIRLKSLQTSLNGEYTVKKAHYLGDTKEGEFTVEIEGSLVRR